MNNFKNQPTRWISILILGMALASQGCTGMRPGYETPSVTVNSFRPIPSQGAMPSFEIGLNVINPNTEALKLVGISYTVKLNGRKLITGVANDLPIIEGYGEGNFTLTASTSLYAGIRFLRDLMSGSKESVRYDLEAKLDIGTFHPAIRIKESGDFSLAPAGQD